MNLEAFFWRQTTWKKKHRSWIIKKIFLVPSINAVVIFKAKAKLQLDTFLIMFTTCMVRQWITFKKYLHYNTCVQEHSMIVSWLIFILKMKTYLATNMQQSKWRHNGNLHFIRKKKCKTVRVSFSTETINCSALSTLIL